MADATALLISLRPRFANDILAGEKRVELRRIRPRISRGDIIVIYASLPVGAIVGFARVLHVTAGAPSLLWKSVGAVSGLRKGEFSEYFRGSSEGFAIHLGTTRRREDPLTLTTLRKKIPGFSPPQCYKYLRPGVRKDACILRLLGSW